MIISDKRLHLSKEATKLFVIGLMMAMTTADSNNLHPCIHDRSILTNKK